MLAQIYDDTVVCSEDQLIQIEKCKILFHFIFVVNDNMLFQSLMYKKYRVVEIFPAKITVPTMALKARPCLITWTSLRLRKL